MHRRRLPASPNKPPPTPAKIVPKGQPVPVNINLLVQGNNVGSKSQRIQSAHYGVERRSRSVGVLPESIRPHTAHVDKHVLKSLQMPQSVDHSFYDRFERLDRDTVVGDMAIKEKGVTTTRARSAGRQRTQQHRVPSAKTKKRSQSATCNSRKPMKNEQINVNRNPSDSFFNLAMSFDDETTQNTLSNAKRQISPRTLGIETKTIENVSRRRPRSAKKSRERSLSSKRSETSDTRSVGSAGSRNNKSIRKEKVDKPEGKVRHRKSRSRTRRILPKCPDDKNSSKKSSPEVKPRSGRSVTRSGRRSSSTSDIVSSLSINHMDTLSTRPFSAKQEQGGAYAYEYLKVGRNANLEKRTCSAKRNGTGISAIEAVKKANEVKDTLNQMKEIDRLMFTEEPRHMHVSSKLPKLKMIVAPTAMPLASYIRNTSAKMLMSNAFESKRKPVNV